MNETQQSANKAISFARGLRMANWPMVAEFMEPGDVVWVSSEQQAKELQDAIHAIPGRQSTRVRMAREFEDQWKVIRTR